MEADEEAEGSMTERKLTKNAAECPTCHDVIESKSVHDFQRCGCGRIFVDGGLEYRRFGWSEAGKPIDRCEYEVVS